MTQTLVQLWLCTSAPSFPLSDPSEDLLSPRSIKMQKGWKGERQDKTPGVVGGLWIFDMQVPCRLRISVLKITLNASRKRLNCVER